MNSAHRLLLALACVMLTGCGSNADVKETLGLNRTAPDEFRVLARPPLSVPPEFNLRPPGPESQYLSGLPAETKAHDQVLGTGGAPLVSQGNAPAADTAVTAVTSGELPSSTDAQFLADAGAAKADPHIRQKLLDESGVPLKDTKYLISTTKQGEPVVDPAKEADRLKQDKDQNKPPTEGETPVIAPKDNGLLGNIF